MTVFLSINFFSVTFILGVCAPLGTPLVYILKLVGFAIATAKRNNIRHCYQ